MPITACADIKQICESLKEETETFNGEGFMQPNAQFVLTRLWAQFSIRQIENTVHVEVMRSEADTEKNIINLTHLRRVLVNRFKIIEINGTNFQINTYSHKKANPSYDSNISGYHKPTHNVGGKNTEYDSVQSSK